MIARIITRLILYIVLYLNLNEQIKNENRHLNIAV